MMRAPECGPRIADKSQTNHPRDISLVRDGSNKDTLRTKRPDMLSVVRKPRGAVGGLFAWPASDYRLGR